MEFPADADLVFDVRFLPNPYYEDELRPLTGMDESVFNYVMDNETARIFANKLEDMVEFLIPKYAQEGKTSLVIAVGCTGGKHRSVTIARELYSRIARNGEYGFRLEHRDVDKDRLLEKNRKRRSWNVFFRDGERRTFQAYRLRKTLQDCGTGCNLYFLRQPGGWN